MGRILPVGVVAVLLLAALSSCGSADQANSLASTSTEAPRSSTTEAPAELPAPPTGDPAERFRANYGPTALPPSPDGSLESPLVDPAGRAASTGCELEDPLVGPTLRAKTWAEADELAASSGYALIGQPVEPVSDRPTRLGGAPTPGASLTPEGDVAFSLDERNDRIWVCLDETDRVVGSWLI